jgi:hypothetical protein
VFTEIDNYKINSAQAENKRSIPEPETHFAIIESIPRPELPQGSIPVKEVTLRMVLGKNGTVTDIKVLEFLPENLANDVETEWKERCIKAVNEIKFLPARKDGRIVNEWFKAEYIFGENGIRVFITTEA